MYTYLINCLHGRLALLIVIASSLFTLGCSEDKQTCGKDGGKAIDCYKWGSGIPGDKNDHLGQYCTEINEPPCNCYTLDKTVNQVNLFTKASQCDPRYGGTRPQTGGTPATEVTGGLIVKEPYYITNYGAGCTPTKGDMVCAEYDNNYRDGSQGAIDPKTRPIYVNFLVNAFNLDEFDYVFEITERASKALIDKKTISKSTISSQNNHIRRLDASSTNSGNCAGPPCIVDGTLIMDIKGATRGTYQVAMYSRKLLDQQVAFLDEGSFVVHATDYSTDNPTISSDRIYNLTIYSTKVGTKVLDLSQYSIANKSFNLAIQHVFGEGKSNMRVVKAPATTTALGSRWADEKANFKLSNSDFSNNDALRADVYDALARYRIRLYRASYNYPVNKYGYVAEGYFVEAYDFNQQPARSIPGFQEYAQKVMTAQASTTIQPLERITTGMQPYVNGTLVYRRNVEIEAKSAFITDDSRISALSLAKMLHELGHQWAISANLTGENATEDDCTNHTHYCRGIGSTELCLFRPACEVLNTPGATKLINAQLANPLFCEWHQQYFMNRLKAKR